MLWRTFTTMKTEPTTNGGGKMKFKATHQDGAQCKVNGVDFALTVDKAGDFSLKSIYDETPLYSEKGKTALRCADAPCGLIEAFGQETAYAMTDAALEAM